MAETGQQGLVNHFRGRSEHALDGKGRLNIAARFREVLRSQGEERLMITPWGHCLKAYPLPQWEELEMTLRAEGAKNPRMHRMIRFMVGGVEECHVDKQGRVLLPPKLRKDGGIEKEVVVNGMITYFEIWDRRTWERMNQPSEEELQEFDQVLLALGQF